MYVNTGKATHMTMRRRRRRTKSKKRGKKSLFTLWSTNLPLATTLARLLHLQIVHWCNGALVLRHCASTYTCVRLSSPGGCSDQASKLLRRSQRSSVPRALLQSSFLHLRGNFTGRHQSPSSHTHTHLLCFVCFSKIVDFSFCLVLAVRC